MLVCFQLILFDLIGKADFLAMGFSQSSLERFQLILFDLIGKAKSN